MQFSNGHRLKKTWAGIWAGVFLIMWLMMPGVAKETTQHLGAIRLIWKPAAPERKASLKKQLQVFKSKPVTPALLKQVRTVIRQFLAGQGYYFPRITTQMDSTPQSSDLTLTITTGKMLILDRVQVRIEPDSLQRLIPPDVWSSLTGKPYLPETPALLQKILQDHFNDHGYPLVQIQQDDYTIRENNHLYLTLHLTIIPGPLVQLQEFYFANKSPAENQYLQRLIGFRKGEIYRQHRLQQYQQRLARLPFVEKVGEISLIRDSTQQFYLLTQLKEKPATSLDGLIGYVPPRQGEEKGYLIGNVTIGIRDLLGPGRELSIFWRKPDPLSENFRLAYRESFLLGLPLHLVGMLNRQVRDTTYIEWQYSARAEVPLTEDTHLAVSITQRSVFPDTLASRLLRLPQTESVISRLRIGIDRRDAAGNPSRGFQIALGFSVENQRIRGPRYLLEEDSLPSRTTLQRIEGQLAVYLRVYKNQVLSNALQVRWLGSSGKRLYRPDLYYFGGSTTLRGYREDQFITSRVVWLNTEYRVLTGSLSRLFAFIDNGAYYREGASQQWQFLLGYGLGARFRSPLGVMQVEMAWARGEPFREAKIHFRLINEF